MADEFDVLGGDRRMLCNSLFSEFSHDFQTHETSIENGGCDLVQSL